MTIKSKDESKINDKTKDIIQNKTISSNSKKAINKTTKKTSNKKCDSRDSIKNPSKTKSVTKKNSSTKKSSSKNSSISKESLNKNPTSVAEYYDLPYRYNETTVKILAQTPTTLFIYWDISDNDRSLYIQKYGDNFFNKTKPILIITNKTMNYTFEVEINDFANSWYLHVNDANCDYSVELGRRPILNDSNIDNYVYITTSNDMEMPNNNILFDKIGKSVFFKNVKNNFINEVPITSMSFIKRLGKIYNVYDLYNEIYKNEINIEDLKSNNIMLDLSSSSSSTFM